MTRIGLEHVCSSLSGTHVCQFYQNAQELLDIQIPFFERGLRDNDRCLWIVDSPLDIAHAAEALRKVVSDLDHRIAAGQFEIIAGALFYDEITRLGPEKVNEIWTMQYDAALANGYANLRVSGNYAVPDPERWKALLEYEQCMNSFLLERSVTALCCYSTQSATLGMFAEVFAVHDKVLIRQNGDWRLIANQAHPQEPAEHVEEDKLSLLDAERAARTRAEHLNRIKDEFLATVSHELRSPLAGILGWTRLVRRGADEQEIKHGLEVVEQNAAVLAQLVDDLLDVSRIITGKIHLQMSTIDTKAFVRTVVNGLQLAANNKNLILERHIPSGLRNIRCDPIRIRQVLWNLLTNAIKFTPAGGRIAVSVKQDETYLTIEVADTGEGISPELLPHVFDKFQQGGTLSMCKHGGLGLGLAIIKHIADLHGGIVQAASEGVNRGATFTVKLPIAPATATDEKPADLMDKNATQALLPEGLVVLLVDDDAEACDMVGRVLKESGAYVVVAHSVAEAWTILSRCKPDLIISDISMPGEDGYALIRGIRSLQSDCRCLPCMALSSLARLEDHEKALAEGFDEHLSKFTEPLELIHGIRAVLRKKGHARAEETSHIAPAPPQKAAARLREGPAHILIAEDDPTTSEMLKLTLEQIGYRISLADSIESALDIAEHSPVDLLLADMRLKDGTGMELMMQLRKIQPVAGIMMSGYSDEMYKLKSKAAGFDEYLVKPVDTDYLCDLLAKIVPCIASSSA